MKQKRLNPSSLRDYAVRTSVAAAFLTMAGWAVTSNAENAATTAPSSDATTTSGTTASSDGDTAADKKHKESEQLQEVAIVAYRITRGSVGSLVDAPVEEIPRNMVAVTEQTLSDQMVTSTVDILKNFPGVQRGSDQPGAEHPRVRGMAAFQFLEGTYSGGLLWDSAEFLSSAELLTGPNSIQYGFLVQGGGAMNYLLKRPSPTSFLDLTVQGNNWGDYKYVVDGNSPFVSARGDGVRFIGVHEAITDFRRTAGHGERNSAALMLTYSGILGIKSEVDYEIVRRDAPGNPNISFSKNPSAPFRSIDPRDSTEQPWENIKRDGERVGGKFSRNLYGTWRTVVTVSNEAEEVFDKSCTLYDPDSITGEGAYTCGTSGFADYTNRSYRMDVLGSFNTFGIRHDVTVGASQLKQTILLPNSFENFTDPPYNANNLYSPRIYPDPTVPTSQQTFNNYRLSQWWTQEYLQDRIRLTPHWDLWAGANEGDVRAELADITGLLNKVTANGLSPSFSLSYTPKDKLRFYVTYADAISPGGQAPVDPHYVNSGERFGPMRFKSYETGVKWQVDNISQLNLNLFREEEPLAYIKVLGPNEFLYTEKGKDRFTGVEFTSTSVFPFGLTLNAGFTLLKPLQVDTGDPTQDNKYVPGVSRESAALYAEYRVPFIPDFALTANATYNSSSPLLATNGFNLGSYTLVDLGGYYVHPVGGMDMTFRLIVTNAFDTRYLSPWYSTVTLGAPRTVMASVSARFGAND